MQPDYVTLSVAWDALRRDGPPEADSKIWDVSKNILIEGVSLSFASPQGWPESAAKEQRQEPEDRPLQSAPVIEQLSIITARLGGVVLWLQIIGAIAVVEGLRLGFQH